MDISNLRPALDPSSLGSGQSAQVGTSAATTGSAAPAAQPAAGAQPSGPAPQATNVSPSTLQKAVQKINQQLEQSSGVTLNAGLDTSGSHPGQVLVELSDKATQQTFFKYYVPAQQVVQASENLGSSGGAQGALISAKA